MLLEESRGIRRIVINRCYGGFGLSDQAMLEYNKLAGICDSDMYHVNISRDDPYLIKVVRDLGMAANGPNSNLKIVEVPADVSWHISEYDGTEWVAEYHRTWS